MSRFVFSPGFLLCVFLQSALLTSIVTKAAGVTHNVTNASQLHSALSVAGAGDEIVLAPANYGAINLDGRTYSGFVIVRSSSLTNRAIMTSLTLTNCRYLEFRNIHVANPTNDGTVVKVETSNDIRLIDSEFHAAVDTNFSGPAYGVHLLKSSNVRVEGCYIHDSSMGTYVTGGTNNELVENKWDRVRGVALTISDLNGLLLENNEFGGHHFPESGTHQDFIKGGGKTNSTNVVIRGNVMIARNRANIQGIFLHGNVQWNNVLIEQNVIYSGMNYGIGITGGSNITVRYNTVLHSHESGGSATAIIVSGSETVFGNIYTNWQERPGNLVLPLGDLNAEYAKYFLDPVTTSLNENYSVFNFIPKPGSAADNPNMGAYQRINELTGFAGAAECNDGMDNDGDGLIDLADGGCSSALDDNEINGAADNCPDDPNKTNPGICGCGIPDVDTDGDGTPDCQDNCDFDPAKVDPGECGCGVPEGTCSSGGGDMSFTLIDADANAPLSAYDPLTDGAVINLALLPTQNLNIRANVSGSVHSVRFGYNNQNNYRTELYAPYALAGDTNGNYAPWTPVLGTQTLSATAFVTFGSIADAHSISFTVMDDASAAPGFNVRYYYEEGETLHVKLPWAAQPPIQWMRNATPLANDGRVAGANSDTLTISPLVIADTGTYSASFDDGSKAIVTPGSFAIQVVPMGALPTGGLVQLTVLALSIVATAAYLLRRTKN